MDAVGPLGSILGSAIALTEIFVIIRTIGYERKHKYPLNSLKIILGIFLLFLLIAIVR
jgi:hypothetical protein